MNAFSDKTMPRVPLLALDISSHSRREDGLLRGISGHGGKFIFGM